RQELCPRLAVAVLARERAAELEHEIGRLVEERAELLDSGLALEVEVPARVHAALPVVAVEGAVVLVLPGQLAQAAEVRAELRGRNGRVLPALVGVGLAGNER